jgi:hypothetical protein
MVAAFIAGRVIAAAPATPALRNNFLRDNFVLIVESS